MTFDLHFRVFPVIIRLVPGLQSIGHEKIIITCKFHILGTKTTLGWYIITFMKKYSCLELNMYTGVLTTRAILEEVCVHTQAYLGGVTLGVSVCALVTRETRGVQATFRCCKGKYQPQISEL